jgi:ferritin-like metal-binding protein YciE
MPAEKTLRDLFHDTLKDIYFAEKKILTALPKTAKAGQSEELKAAFEKHEAETEGQVERLANPSWVSSSKSPARADSRVASKSLVKADSKTHSGDPGR